MFTVVPRSWNPPPKSQCIHKPCFTYCSSAIGSFLVLLLGQVEGFICPPDVTIQFFLKKKNMVIIEVFLIKLQFYCICFFLSFFFVNKALQWLTKCKLHVLKFWNVNFLYFAVYYTHKHRVQETSCNPFTVTDSLRRSHTFCESSNRWVFKQDDRRLVGEVGKPGWPESPNPRINICIWAGTPWQVRAGRGGVDDRHGKREWQDRGCRRERNWRVKRWTW